jgi:MFS family permease
MSAYFAVMGAKCALPSVMSLLTSSTGLTFPIGRNDPQQLVARLLLLSTAAIAMGKVLLGPIIDFFGGITSLQVSLACLAFLLTSISFCQSFMVFGISWILVDFIFSSCWAACINAIHQSFPEQVWAKQIGRLAAAARAGNSIAFMFFSFILRYFERSMVQCWRPVFGIAALAQLFPIAMLTLYGQPIVKTKKVPGKVVHPSIRSSLKILKREAATLDFWLHLVSRSALMLFASFLLFVPTLMTQVYKTSSAAGAQVGSLYAMGCFLSVTTGSKLYSSLGTRGKLWLVTFLLLFGATGSSVAQLGHMANWWTLSLNASVLTMFVWGFSFAIPFYIPPSLYALSKGRKDSSATIADVFDIGGFGLLAAFNGLVASWITNGTKASWIPTFQITTGCSLLSFLALPLAIWREKL